MVVEDRQISLGYFEIVAKIGRVEYTKSINELKSKLFGGYVLIESLKVLP